VTIIRPSARVKLTIRTEEFQDTAELESRLPRPVRGIPQPPPASSAAPASTTADASDNTAARLERNQERRRALALERSSLSAEEFEQQQREIDDEWEDIYRGIAERADAETRPPESVVGSARDDLTVLGEILPISVQIERNGLSTADTATVELNYIDAPIRPEDRQGHALSRSFWASSAPKTSRAA